MQKLQIAVFVVLVLAALVFYNMMGSGKDGYAVTEESQRAGAAEYRSISAEEAY